MKNVNSRMLLVAVIALGFFATVSCKKSSSTNDSCAVSSTTIIGKYKIKAIEFVLASDPTHTPQNALALLPSCDTANVIELQAGGVGTITYTNTPNACSTSPVTTGTWSLSGDTLTSSQENLSGTVTNFSCTGGFTLTSTTPVSGLQGTSTITLARQ